MVINTSLEGQSVAEFELILSGSRRVAIGTGQVVHLGSLIVETIHGWSYSTHRFQSLDTSFFEGTLKAAMASGTPRIRFRHGIGSGKNVQWIPWQNHFIIGCAGNLTGLSSDAGHLLEIDTADNLHQLNRYLRTESHKGKISDIVASIASRNKISNQVIEPTDSAGVYAQSYGGDLDFVQDRLLPRATNSKGRGNYLFFMRDGTLHFHSPDWQTEVKELRYYQSTSTSLTQIDDSQALLAKGVSGTRVLAYSPYTGEAKELASDAGKALRLADSIYELNTLRGTELIVPYHTAVNPEAANPDAEAVNIGQNAYQAARMSTFRILLRVKKLITLRAGNFIRLVISPAGNKASSWSGLYLVETGKHDLSKNAIESAYTLIRGEFLNLLGGALTVNTPNNVLVSEEHAPGQSLNILDAAGSDRTRGAGKINEKTVFSTVSDPNKP